MTDRSAIGIPPTFPGAPWLATHQATVDGVLAGTGVSRRVISRGARFENEDHWTALRFSNLMIEWARKHPRAAPFFEVITGWVNKANKPPKDYQPRIIIARTPKKLNHRVALALVGGGNHEAWHTLFGRRKPLHENEMGRLVNPRWAKLKDWSCRVRLLRLLFRIIEDIRIERRGIERQPATRQSMIDLQDYILAQEEQDRLRAQAQGLSEEDCFNPFSVLTGTFRDLGFGYNTRASREILTRRKLHQPEIVSLVGAVLQEHLQECIELAGDDDLGFIRKGMDVVIALEEHLEIQEESEGGDETTEDSSAVPDEGEGEGEGEGAGTASLQEALDSAKNDAPKLREVGDALGEAFAQANLKEEDLQGDELPWRPFDTSLDVAEFPAGADLSKEQDQANELLAKVKRPIADLRAKFRVLMRALEMREDEHGLRKGPRLSERMLVDTYVEIMDDVPPTRAYSDIAEEIDTSVALVLSRDQSSSTVSIKDQLDQCMFAMAEPVENIGGQVMAFGWRTGQPGSEPADPHKGIYHRYHGMQYDVFKTFGERLANVKARFTRTVSKGGTPMADGIEYGLMALSDRPEAHRLLFVITDGKPPSQLLPIIRNQVRRAKKAGVHVVGVGCGEAGMKKRTLAEPNPLPYVADVFEDWVYEEDVADLPQPLVRKLSQILHKTAHKRGHRVPQESIDEA